MPSYVESPPAPLEAFRRTDCSCSRYAPGLESSRPHRRAHLQRRRRRDNRHLSVGHLLPGELGYHPRLLHPRCGRVQQGRHGGPLSPELASIPAVAVPARRARVSTPRVTLRRQAHLNDANAEQLRRHEIGAASLPQTHSSRAGGSRVTMPGASWAASHPRRLHPADVCVQEHAVAEAAAPARVVARSSPWAAWPSPPGCPWSEACPRPKPNWPGRTGLLAWIED
jgi:hypothetical protein